MSLDREQFLSVPFFFPQRGGKAHAKVPVTEQALCAKVVALGDEAIHETVASLRSGRVNRTVCPRCLSLVVASYDKGAPFDFVL
jgi:hypothetical protein